MSRKMAKADKSYTVIETGEGFETREDSSDVETFDGKTLETPISYKFRYNVYSTLDAAKKSEDWPSENAVWAGMSVDAERAAKATAYQKATAKLREAKMATPEYKLAQLIAQAVAMGMSADQAETFARSTPIGQQAK